MSSDRLVYDAFEIDVNVDGAEKYRVRHIGNAPEYLRWAEVPRDVFYALQTQTIGMVTLEGPALKPSEDEPKR